MLACRVLASPCAGRAAVRVCASRGRARPSLPAPSYGANTKVRFILASEVNGARSATSPVSAQRSEAPAPSSGYSVNEPIALEVNMLLARYMQTDPPSFKGYIPMSSHMIKDNEIRYCFIGVPELAKIVDAFLDTDVYIFRILRRG